MRARFLLALSFVILGAAALAALSLAPAEVSLVFFSPPPARAAQGGVNPAQDRSATAHTEALLSAMRPFEATSSLADVSEALSQLPSGVSVDTISYSIVGHSLTITGKAQTPDQVNALRQALQKDTAFGNVSVPVSALLGSQGGGFTITMNVIR